MTKTLAVTGASGHLGRRVVELLLERNAGPIVAITRDPAKLADVAKRGVLVRRADFDDPTSLVEAFASVNRLLLVSTDALDRPGRRIAQHRAAIAAAAKAGVRHVVYTSAPAPHPTSEDSLISDHYWTEQALAATGLGWTILRDNIYAEIALMALSHAVPGGKLFTAAQKGGRSYVTREDCARTAAAALASDWEGRRILDVTGPAPVTQDELAVLASELTGKPVAHVTVPPAGLREGLLGAGLPPMLADGLVAFDIAAAQGHHAIVTSTVQDLTGRAPTTLREFLTANRAALSNPSHH